MTLPSLSRLRPATICVLLIVVAASGCGQKTYEAKFQATLKDLQNETPFRKMFRGPVTLPETTLTLRLPQEFGQDKQTYALDQATPDPRDHSRQLTDGRLQPKFLVLPGHIRTYERTVDIKDPRTFAVHHWPCYCYIAVVNAKERTAEELSQSIQSQLATAFGEISDAELAARPDDGSPPAGARPWQEIERPTPDGGTIKLSKIVAIGDQDFHFYNKKNEARVKFFSGIYILYLYSKVNRHVMIAWRAPHEVVDALNLEELADACAGTILLSGEQDLRSKLEDI